MLELCHTHIAISDNMNVMGLTGSKTVNLSATRNNSTNDNGPSSRSLTLPVLFSMHVVTAQNHMHQADLHAPLRILCVLVVAIQATGSYAVGAVVAHKPPSNQKALRRSKVATAATAGNVDTDKQMW